MRPQSAWFFKSRSMPMQFIDPIRLADLRVTRVTEARPGTLLQVNDAPHQPLVALKAELPGADGPSCGVVGLFGEPVGIFIADGELPGDLGLDISDLAEIVLTEPAPRPAGLKDKVTRGIVCRSANARNEWWTSMAVALPHQPDEILGYVHLDGPDCGRIEMVDGQPVLLGKAALLARDRRL
jgi:hypothetical protein